MSITDAGMNKKTLAEIFSWMDNRLLALPELQRPSVWGHAKIPRLACDYAPHPTTDNTDSAVVSPDARCVLLVEACLKTASLHQSDTRFSARVIPV